MVFRRRLIVRSALRVSSVSRPRRRSAGVFAESKMCFVSSGISSRLKRFFNFSRSVNLEPPPLENFLAAHVEDREVAVLREDLADRGRQHRVVHLEGLAEV